MARKVGVTLDGVTLEGFRIVAKPPHIALAGRDTGGSPFGRFTLTGTAHAVYAFLERFCGFRWYLPTNLGEVYHKTGTLSVPADLSIREEPSFVYRATQLGRFISVRLKGGHPKRPGWLMRAEKRWMLRNKLNGARRIQCQHIWKKVMPLGAYASRHPEYFAMRDGRRVSAYRGNGGGGGQLDTTNPEVVAMFCENVKQTLRQRPDMHSHSLSLNDGGGVCQCRRCQAADEAAKAGKGNFSDRLLMFYDACATEIGAEFPEKFFGIYAYGGLNSLPCTLDRVSPQLFMEHVSNHMETYFAPGADQEEIGPMRKFGEFGLSMGYYSAATHRFNPFPVSLVPVIRDFFPKLRKVNTVGWYIYPTAEGDWGGRGLTFYVMARMGWDVKTDVKKLLSEYYERFYGAGGEHVRQYHTVLEDALRGWATDKKAYRAHDRAKIARDIYRRTRPQARQALDRAMLAAPNETVRKRIELLSNGYRLVELMLPAVELDARIRSARKPDKADVIAYKKIADEWYDFVHNRKEKDRLDFSYLTVALYERSYVSRDLANFYVARHVRGAKARVACPRVAKPPAIDGVLNEPFWFSAKKLPMLGNGTGLPPQTGTDVRVGYDRNNLYVAFVCREPKMALIRDSVVHRDGPVYKEHDVEVYLDPNIEGQPCYQFLSNSLGTPMDLRRPPDGKPDAAWNPAWQVKTSRSRDAWSVEMAIPFASLGLRPPLPGDVWRANFFRVRQSIGGGPKEYFGLAPTFGGFYQPRFFAGLIFN